MWYEIYVVRLVCITMIDFCLFWLFNFVLFAFAFCGLLDVLGGVLMFAAVLIFVVWFDY